MGQDLAKIAPIPLPDVHRPAKLTSLPRWVEERCECLKMDMQPGPSGRYQQTPVLPKEMIPSETQRGLITNHASAIDSILGMTPENDYQHGQQVALSIGKLLLALPSKESGDLAMEAKSEAYMAALEDVPFWAVQEAMRRWYRGEYGSKHDYRWQPAPSVLRELAMIETYRVRSVRRKLTQLIDAKPPIEYGEDHCRRMREKIASLGIAFQSTSGSSGGSTS
jgi:hypothetical protein